MTNCTDNECEYECQAGGGRCATPGGNRNQDEVVETAQAMELSVSTPEELATAVDSTIPPTLDHSKSATVSVSTPIRILTTVSSSMPTLVPIYSMATTTASVPSTLVPICDAMTDILR